VWIVASGPWCPLCHRYHSVPGAHPVISDTWIRPAAQWRALHGAGAGTMPISSRHRLLLKRGAATKRRHEPWVNVTSRCLPTSLIPASAVGASRMRLVVPEWRRGRSTRRQRLRRPARFWGRADRPASHSADLSGTRPVRTPTCFLADGRDPSDRRLSLTL
jgi:hypothetical protein